MNQPLLQSEPKGAARAKASMFYNADEYMDWFLGGRHRWNEMLFHDVHHAFPNAVGTLSQRGRFHGWQQVHDAAAKILARGIFKPNGDAETVMEKQQKKRSILLKDRIESRK